MLASFHISVDICIVTKLNLEILVESLLLEISELKKRVVELEEENKELRFKLNSRNSSLPPSTDIGLKPKKNRSLRPKTKKSSGGQTGHKGSNLKMVSNPDKVVDYKVSNCIKCAHNLLEYEQSIKTKRQVFDIPPIQMEVTEHRQHELSCPKCGQHNRSEFSPVLNKVQAQYGSNLQSLVTYLSVRQYMPMNRLVELINVLTSQKISEGTIYNMLRRSAKKALPVYEGIRKIISTSEVVGSDESGCNVKGSKSWMWVFQTTQHSYFKISNSRGYKEIIATFPSGLPSSIVVSDCWAAQLKTPSKAKQVCVPHLIRSLNELIDRYNSKWAHKTKEVLYDLIKLSQQDRISKEAKVKIENQIDIQLNRPLTKSKKKVITLRDRLIKYRSYLTTCLYHEDVPADNNGSERAIRNMKVKAKVSGLFRSQKGADIYAILRSVVDTAIKQGISPSEAIKNPSLITI